MRQLGLYNSIKIQSVMEEYAISWGFQSQYHNQRFLSLVGNNIHYRGSIALADALKPNSTIMEVHLSGNEIRAEGATALVETSKKNINLCGDDIFVLNTTINKGILQQKQNNCNFHEKGKNSSFMTIISLIYFHTSNSRRKSRRRIMARMRMIKIKTRRVKLTGGSAATYTNYNLDN